MNYLIGRRQAYIEHGRYYITVSEVDALHYQYWG